VVARWLGGDQGSSEVLAGDFERRFGRSAKTDLNGVLLKEVAGTGTHVACDDVRDATFSEPGGQQARLMLGRGNLRDRGNGFGCGVDIHESKGGTVAEVGMKKILRDGNSDTHCGRFLSPR
jgi:hypothetical protein